MPGIILPHNRSYDEVFDLDVEMPSLSFADCCQVILAQQWCNGMLISFDEKIDQAPGITRRTPGRITSAPAESSRLEL